MRNTAKCGESVKRLTHAVVLWPRESYWTSISLTCEYGHRSISPICLRVLKLVLLIFKFCSLPLSLPVSALSQPPCQVPRRPHWRERSDAVLDELSLSVVLWSCLPREQGLFVGVTLTSRRAQHTVKVQYLSFSETVLASSHVSLVPFNPERWMLLFPL